MSTEQASENRVVENLVIYHKSDLDGIFCREIAALKYKETDTDYVGWTYGDPTPIVPPTVRFIYMLDISIEELMADPRLIWIDHHKTAIEKFPATIAGYRVDGVAACRLVWQFLFGGGHIPLPTLEMFVNRELTEPYAVRLAGEHDVWDHRDPNSVFFQYGMRTTARIESFAPLLANTAEAFEATLAICKRGVIAKEYADHVNASIVLHKSFTVKWHGITFLCLNSAQCSSETFKSGLKDEHEAMLDFYFNGDNWVVSMYGREGHDIDLSAIAKFYGGGGHKAACGFVCECPPFMLRNLTPILHLVIQTLLDSYQRSSEQKLV